MKISFTKMHGAGNDFIMIDHREGFLSEGELPTLVQKLCTRKFHVGANGLILVEKSEHARFKMRYFNRDGSETAMCGNGARCVLKFAHTIGACSDQASFETMNDLYEGTIHDDGTVSIAFPNIPLEDISVYTIEHKQFYYIPVGVPHVVLYDQDIFQLEAEAFHHFGKRIRQMADFFPEGTNVNVVHQKTDGLAIRTYERGVEEETFACGTGATATAIISHLYRNIAPPTNIHMKGGKVTIDFQAFPEEIKHISLRGEAQIAFTGMIQL